MLLNRIVDPNGRVGGALFVYFVQYHSMHHRVQDTSDDQVAQRNNCDDDPGGHRQTTWNSRHLLINNESQVGSIKLHFLRCCCLVTTRLPRSTLRRASVSSVKQLRITVIKTDQLTFIRLSCTKTKMRHYHEYTFSPNCCYQYFGCL